MPPKTLAILLLCALLPACGANQHAAPRARSGLAVADPASEARRSGATRRHAAAAGDAARAEQYLALAIEKGADGADLLPTLLVASFVSSCLATQADEALLHSVRVRLP
jgi:hypothetical protein